jgi:hypothetical protein
MIKRGIGVMAFAIGLLCCDNVKDEESEKELSIPTRVLYPQNAVSQRLDSLRPPTQHFNINSEKDTVVIGFNGILIAIGGNTFINSEEETVTGKIDLTLVEVQSLSEIIGAGLQTTAGDDILQTAGMIFIDARSNGESLGISEGKSIVVSMSSQRAFTNAKAFSGEFDKEGYIDWKKVSGMEKDLIPFPIEYLDFNDGAWECWYTEEQLKFLQDSKFKNTFIHTREFERRMHIFNYYATCPQMKDLDDEIIDIYTGNTQNNLFYADSLVALHLINNYSSLIDTTKVFEFNDVGWISHLYRSSLQFAQERFGKPLNFEELRIDGTSTLQQLIHRGYAETEATHILNLYNVREQMIKSRKNKREVRDLESYVFSTTDLGWINVDRFLTDREASESHFTVRINSKDSLDVFAVSLLIPTYSVVLGAMNAHEDIYSFTKKEDGYRKLPVGEDAFLVAVSYKNDKSYFGKQKIKIPRDGQVELDIEEASQNEIKREIANLLK